MFYGIQEILTIPKFCEMFKISPGIKDKTVIIQGIGNVGYWAAKFCETGGAKIIGLVEYNSSIYNPDGLHIEEAAAHFREHKSFKDFPKATEVKLDDERLDIMYRECDILIPAAIENSVTK